MSITADLGLVGLIPDSGCEDAYVNQHIALVRLEGGRTAPEYIAAALASEVGQVQVRRLNDGGAKAGLNLPNIRRLLVPLPPLEEQRMLTAPLASFEDRVEVERANLRALKDVKSALMSVLLTGEVRVRVDEEAAA